MILDIPNPSSAASPIHLRRDVRYATLAKPTTSFLPDFLQTSLLYLQLYPGHPLQQQCGLPGGLVNTLSSAAHSWLPGRTHVCEFLDSPTKHLFFCHGKKTPRKEKAKYSGLKRCSTKTHIAFFQNVRKLLALVTFYFTGGAGGNKPNGPPPVPLA